MKRILIVDDNADVRLTTQVVLKTLTDWDILLAENGEKGLEIAQVEQPDAILLDVMMPGMDGITTLQHLQANPDTQPIPVILFTSVTHPGEHIKFNILPISGIILKPFDPDEFVKQICSFLNWQ